MYLCVGRPGERQRLARRSCRERGRGRGEGWDAPLDKDEERLVPQDGHLARVALEPQEVEHERVDDLVRQRVLLVEQDPDEDAVRTCCASLVRQGRASGDRGREREKGGDAPVYSISASLSRAAPECRTGTLTLVRTEPRMAASRRVQVPLCVQEILGQLPSSREKE